MKTILVSAYAVNPYKGSEDGTGWNWVRQIAQDHKVIAITRENNQEAIDKYKANNVDSAMDNITFAYFDLPYWMRFWKKGSRGSMLYFFLWQIGIVFFIRKQKWGYDIAHNLNFHNDWTPSFLWLLKKPFVWGPIGHHPPIPKDYILPIYGAKAFMTDRLKWFVKRSFWLLSPSLKKTKTKANQVIAINSSVKEVLQIDSTILKIPAVGGNSPTLINKVFNEQFRIISVGRFVPLKGFDVAIRSFAKFYHSLPIVDQGNVQFTIIGKGPSKSLLMEMAKELDILKAIQFVEWMEQSKLFQLYQKADLFFFPSHEGAGMVVPEALSYGLPVLCFDNVGPGEFINETCGIKIPYTKYNESVGSFAEKLSALYLDTAKRKAMSEAAIKHFKSNFEWSNKAAQIKAVYQKIAG